MRSAKKQQKKYKPICRNLFRRVLNAVIDKQRRIEGQNAQSVFRFHFLNAS